MTQINQAATPPAPTPPPVVETEVKHTKAEVEAMLAEERRKLQAQHNFEMAEQRRKYSEAPKVVSDSSATPAVPKSDPPRSAEVLIKEALDKREYEHSVNDTLKTGFGALGAKDPEQLSAFFLFKYGDRVASGPDGKPVFKETDGAVTPLGTYLQAWVKSAGATFVPAPSVPSTPGLNGSESTVEPGRVNAFRNMSFAEVQERRKVDRAGYNAYISQHREEFRRKQAAFESHPFAK